MQAYRYFHLEGSRNLLQRVNLSLRYQSPIHVKHKRNEIIYRGGQKISKSTRHLTTQSTHLWQMITLSPHNLKSKRFPLSSLPHSLFFKKIRSFIHRVYFPFKNETNKSRENVWMRCGCHCRSCISIEDNKSKPSLSECECLS